MIFYVLTMLIMAEQVN